MDVVAQQSFVVERHNLRDLAGLRGHALWGRLLGSRLRRDEEHSHQEKHPLFIPTLLVSIRFYNAYDGHPERPVLGEGQAASGALPPPTRVSGLHHRIRSTR